jgi:hypothetical protein
MAASQAFSQRLSLAKQDGGGKRSQLMSKWSAAIGEMYLRVFDRFVVEQTRSCLRMSVSGGKADMARACRNVR